MASVWILQHDDSDPDPAIVCIDAEVFKAKMTALGMTVVEDGFCGYITARTPDGTRSLELRRPNPGEVIETSLRRSAAVAR
jgi:hypothetical protein